MSNTLSIAEKFVKIHFVLIWFGFQTKKKNICLTLTEVDYIITKYSL